MQRVMKWLTRAVRVSCLAFPLLLSLVVVQAAKGKPNIIFIMADDLGWQDVGFNGSKWIDTPHLNALAKESRVFSQAYMYPTCSPSRAALMTGKQSFRTQVYTVPVLERGNAKTNLFSRWTVEEKHPFYSKPLNEAGYQLIHIGKWHVVGPNPEQETNYPFKRKLGAYRSGDMSWLEKHRGAECQKYYPRGKGFHENVGGTWWGDPARGYKAGYKSTSGGYIAPYKNPFIEEGKDGEWLTDRLTDEAMQFIRKHKDQPFFVNLHYYAPHRPSVPRSQELLKKYETKGAEPGTGQKASRSKELAAYATMVESIDQNVGRLVRFLDENGLRDNTVLIFTSDNGFNSLQNVNDALRGYKGTIYEGGIRVPALVRWPGHIQSGVDSQPICGMDYFPTFLDLAGVRDGFKGVLDGRSLLPALQGEAMESRPLFWHIASTYKHPPCSVMRQGDWKLVQFLLSGELELYNLKSDPREEKNLAESMPEITSEMLTVLQQWRKKNQVPLPEASTLSH